jgi:carboxyl-terminal processing protease
MILKIGRIILFSFFFTAVLFAGFWIGKNSVACEFCQPQSINFSLFWEALDSLKNNFVSPQKIDEQKIVYGAISGMVKSLGDPYTVFFDPEENKRFKDDVNGSFEGIGAEIGIRKNQLQIIAPLEGTPAQKAGLRSGDKILKIGDKST